jgi:hypothetical protein
LLSPDGATVTILNPLPMQELPGKIAHGRPIGRKRAISVEARAGWAPAGRKRKRTFWVGR